MCVPEEFQGELALSENKHGQTVEQSDQDEVARYLVGLSGLGQFRSHFVCR